MNFRLREEKTITSVYYAIEDCSCSKRGFYKKMFSKEQYEIIYKFPHLHDYGAYFAVEENINKLLDRESIDYVKRDMEIMIDILNKMDIQMENNKPFCFACGCNHLTRYEIMLSNVTYINPEFLVCNYCGTVVANFSKPLSYERNVLTYEELIEIRDSDMIR